MSKEHCTLEALFKEDKSKKFMAHVYAGDPTLAFSEKLIAALDKGGIDILELGIPFADPLADGKVFQHTCQRALENGTTPKNTFDVAKKVRKTLTKPIVVTTYYNIIYQMGIKTFVDTLSGHNIQGVIVPDISLEESDELRDACNAKGIHLIYLVAPTTPAERVKKITAVASGFIYLVSVTGVTGTEKKAKQDIKDVVKNIRANSDIPILIGFGIASPEDIKKLEELDVDGYIVGSQITRLYQEQGEEDTTLAHITEFAQSLKKSM